MLRKLLLTGLFLVSTGLCAFAQTGTITGTVTDAQSGETLPGTNVYIQSIQQGSTTDADGNFTISNIPVGTYTLQASFVGYTAFEQQVEVTSGTQTVNIQLQSGLGLNEVVVTALGIKREQRAIGYSVQEVSSEDLQKSQQTNVVNALAGKIAGVQINNSSGQPGSSSRITIRGNSSLLGNNQPLFVVDGIPISNAEDSNPSGSALFTGGTSNRGLDIDPNTIENISVLKGASATALYGSRAANGAIIITTKNGERGQKPRVTVNSSVKWDDAITEGYQDQYLEGSQGFYANGLPRDRGGYTEPGYPLPNPDNPNQLPNSQTTLSWGPNKNNISEQVLSDLGVDNIQTYDPREQFYKTGVTFDNSLSLAGGTDKSNYYLSVNNSDQGGIVPETKLERTSILGKYGSQLGDQLNVSTSINYINDVTDRVSQGNGPSSYLYGLNFTPINFDLKPATFEDGTQRMNSSAFNNPFWLVNNNGFESTVDRFIGNTNIDLDLTPWLTVSEKLGIDTYNDKRKGKMNVGTRGTPNGSMFDQKITRTQVNSDLTLNANRDLNEDFNLQVLLGNNINSRYYNSDVAFGEDLNIPGFFNISNASVQTAQQNIERVRLYSFYGQATLDYKDYAFLTLTGRNDWSSTLPKDNNSYFYPSASVGFVFTDALNLSNDILSYGKIRGSVSQIGNDADPYSLSTNFIQANPGDGVRGNINFPLVTGVNGYQLNNVLGNPDLKPEITTEYEFGFNLKFFQNRGSLDFSYYTKTSKNQIFQVPVSPATGFAAKLGNAGSLKNYGVEISAGVTPIQTKNFSWDLNANFAKNTTEVVKLAEGVDNIFLGGFTDPQIRIDGEEGYGVIWGTHFKENDQGQTLIDSTGLPVVGADPGPIGNVQPDWTGSLRTTFNYRGVSLSALFDEKHGGDVLNMDLYYSTYYGTAKVTENRGSEITYEGVNVNTGVPNDMSVTRDETYYRGFYSSIDQNFVEDGSYIKLRELSLSYTLPQSLVANTPIHALTVTGTGYNLWIHSDFSYGDPEGSLLGTSNAQGFYHDVTPSTRSYTLSVKISF